MLVVAAIYDSSGDSVATVHCNGTRLQIVPAISSKKWTPQLESLNETIERCKMTLAPDRHIRFYSEDAEEQFSELSAVIAHLSSRQLRVEYDDQKMHDAIVAGVQAKVKLDEPTVPSEQVIARLTRLRIHPAT
jgi:hypothetical protein